VESCPTLGVLGNHDNHYGSSVVLQMLYRAGVKSLVNQVHTIQRSGESFHFAGMNDVWNVRDAKICLDRILNLLPENVCAVLMVHKPDYADVSAATGRFDLQISGHSHGGQVVLPFIGPPILPEMGEKYPQGMYQYTNRGVGMTPPNIRFNCRPEITVFTLECV
jgi:predicted MPP superfamily phosphohydrolase